MRWKDKALCADKDLSLFFASPKSDSTALAFSICKSCPVRSECFHEALVYGYDGTWGGSTLDQRRAIIVSHLDSDLSNLNKSNVNDLIKVVDKIGRTKNTALTDIYNSTIHHME